MAAARIILLLMLTLLVCESCKEYTPDLFKPTIKTIACEELGSRKVTIYKTTKPQPLYRGGWDFVTLEGKQVLSTCKCHYVQDKVWKH